MKIFLDTANINEIKEGVALGVVDGVTTNPTLVAKEKRSFRPHVEEICAIVPGDVSLEVVATDFEGMVKEGEELAQIAQNVVVKCPLTKDGLKAVKHLTGKGIRVNQTLCFSATQALLSAKAGAFYISPFLGRLDDIGAVGMDLVRDICEIYRVQGFKTQVLAASIRNPLHVIDAAKISGVAVGTIQRGNFESPNGGAIHLKREVRRRQQRNHRLARELRRHELEHEIERRRVRFRRKR